METQFMLKLCGPFRGEEDVRSQVVLEVWVVTEEVKGCLH